MGMREEAEVITALCKNKDIHVLFENNVENLLLNCGDIWDFTKDYYNETRQVPDISIIVDRFKDFDPVVTTSPTVYAVNRLKETYLDESL